MDEDEEEDGLGQQGKEVITLPGGVFIFEDELVDQDVDVKSR